MEGSPMRKTLVIVGCGSAKADRRRAAKNLYTSTYFQKKRAYAETVGDEWLILSAQHGLIEPETTVAPYDTSIEDLDSEARDGWADGVGWTLGEWVAHARADDHTIERVDVLLGRRYCDPLRERGVFEALSDVPVAFPFQEHDLGGIGEQLAWLEAAVVDWESPTCKRCGRSTQATTLDGDYLCNYCQDHRTDQHETRDANQQGLGAWSE